MARVHNENAQTHKFDGIIELGYSAPKALRLGMIPQSLRERFPHLFVVVTRLVACTVDHK